MKYLNPIKSNAQRGMALIIALLLLIVLTILGVASMSGVIMQERMAGNVNLQTLAFEAASAGVSVSPQYGLDSDNWGGNGACVRGSGGWGPTPWTNFQTLDLPGLPPGLEVAYRQRIGCFEPDAADIPPEWDDPDFDVPVQLLVLNQGVVRMDGVELSRREVEVRVEPRGAEQQCAMRIEGTVDPQKMPNSQFSVDGGEGGCPISVSEGGGAQDIIDAIGENRIGNYEPVNPGIHESEGFAPWNSSSSFADITNLIKTGVQSYEDFMAFGGSESASQADWLVDLSARQAQAVLAGNNAEAEFLGRLLDFSADKNIVNCRGRFYAGNVRPSTSSVGQGQNACNVDFGSAPNSQARWHNQGNDVSIGVPFDPTFITYVAGHVGNPAGENGSGILIAEGGSCWSANATFHGMQLLLGGHYEMIGGGGQNHYTEGAIVLTRLNNRYGQTGTPDFHALRGSGDLRRNLPFADPGSAYFDNTNLFFAGGGGHSIRFKCADDGTGPGLLEYVDKINSCIQLEEPLLPNCDPDGMGRRETIASWREYIDGLRWAE